ncbi:MAG: tetratricopeptide repeat protein [Lentimicrobiaceae bacterium]|jgi:tetratricopeptide (TPR) repeat protein|nr:tetratricopeptide repeat protein [Lentimicrobiaceae bacterium]
MAYQMTGLHCPNCGGSQFTEDQKNCLFCGGAVILTSISNVQSFTPLDLNKYANSYRKQLADNPNNDALNMSLAMCYLQLRLYDKALPVFEKAMDDNLDNSEVFFYAAVALLRGKKAFIAQRTDINKVIEYLNAAIMIEAKGLYFSFLAYVKYDYFERKFLNISPNWQEEIQNGAIIADFSQLAEILQVEMPECLLI